MTKKIFLTSLFIVSLIFCSCSEENKAQEFTSGENVILITLDGVRWQEFFNGIDTNLSSTDKGTLFGNLWRDFVPEGVVYGDPTTSSSIKVANPYVVSLPAYESIFAGSVRNCPNNDCPRVDVETFPERLVRELSWKKSQVACIASWEKIALAFESTKGSTFVNTGLTDLKDPDSGDRVSDFEKINKLQNKDAPNWSEVRFDRHTFAHAMVYLVKYRPRFLYISMNDSDEYAHMNEYAKYSTILREHDAWLKLLFKTLDDLGQYGKNTTVIVTTDHGRGSTASDWTEHGAAVPGAEKIWLFAKGPHTPKMGSVKTAASYTHLNIRPTIEKLLGLDPCTDCQSPLPEVIQNLPASTPSSSHNGTDGADAGTDAGDDAGLE